MNKFLASIVIGLLSVLHNDALSMNKHSLYNQNILQVHDDESCCCCFACSLATCFCITGTGTVMTLLQTAPQEITIPGIAWMTALASTCYLGKEFLVACNDRIKEKKEKNA